DPGDDEADPALHGRAHRVRKGDRPGKLCEQRHPDQWRADRRIPGGDLLSELTAARRRGNRAREPDPGGRLRAAAGRGGHGPRSALPPRSGVWWRIPRTRPRARASVLQSTIRPCPPALSWLAILRRSTSP